MAKNKKEMTPEERLAAALVPEEEQPYELPEGWKWVYGTGFFLPMETEYPTGDSFRYIDIESIDNSVQRVRCPKNLPVKKAPSRASRKLHIGDTLFSMVRPYLKNIAYIDEEYSDCIGSTGFYVCTPTPLVDRHYLYWLMVSPFVVNGLNHFMKGDNSPSIRKGDIEKFVYPIPPLSEQHRLVARIESLFAKLDAAKEKVQSVLDSHETRKAALLHDAFTGKLTAKWREERGLTEKIYKTVPLNQVCDSIFDGDHMPPPKSNSGIPFLVIANVNKGKLNFTGTRFVPQDYYESLTDTRKPQNGDVLYTLVGTYGISVLVDTDEKFCFQRHMALLKPNKSSILQKYLWYTLQEKDFYQKATKIAKGTAQLTVPIKGLRQLTIPLPSLPEQQEIVRILGRLLAREQRARQTAEETLTAIERMKQAILARAFRGEL